MVEQTILQRVADGDQTAVQECIDRYSGLVWSLARRFLRADGEAEDAVQDAFIDVWKSAGRFDPGKASEQAFVAMIARRRIIDRMRKTGRRPELPMDDDAPEPASTEHRKIERGTEAGIAAEAVAALPENRRRVIEMAVYSGMTHREISEAVSMPLGTVKSHITRGLATVREALTGPGAHSAGGDEP